MITDRDHAAPPAPPACLGARERLALAAELEDLVAHRLTAVHVQAAAAERLPDGAAQAMAEALRVVVRLAAEATDDLRRLARLLDDGRPPTLSPTPDLATLPALLDGRPGVVVDVDPGLGDLPAGVALCAFRYVELLLGAGAEQLTLTRRQGDLCVAGGPRGGGTDVAPVLAAARSIAAACRGSVRVRGSGDWLATLTLTA